MRRAASVPTTGSAIDDRILIELAENLESEAASMDRGYMGNKPSPKDRRPLERGDAHDEPADG
jgi:hypothetical protein